MDEKWFHKRDTTLQHPRCVWNLLKNTLVAHTHLMWSPDLWYTKEDFKVCEYIAETAAKDKTALPVCIRLTQHTVGATKHSYLWR